MSSDDKDILDRLENASPEEAKKIVIESIVPQCRNVAANFFDCVEGKLKELESKNLNLQQMENEFNNNITPFCMGKFDLESCLKKYSPGH